MIIQAPVGGDEPKKGNLLSLSLFVSWLKHLNNFDWAKKTIRRLGLSQNNGMPMMCYPGA